MFSYAVAVFYLILGPGTLGIHLASAYIAILTIPAMFLLSEEFFRSGSRGILRQWGGLLSALILSLSYWHLNWSRYSVRVILIPLFGSLIFFFLLRGLRRRHPVDFVFAVILIGFGLYTYHLAQLLPLLVLMAFLFEFIARRSFGKRDGLMLLLVFIIAGLIWLPLANYAYAHPGVFNQRVRGVFIFNDFTSTSEELRQLLLRGWQTLLMFVYEGDSTLSTNLPGRPVFNPFLAVFFFVGIVISAWRWRQPRYLFLLTWLVIMVAPATLADSAAMGKRALGALPAALLCITVGLLQPLEIWIRSKR